MVNAKRGKGSGRGRGKAPLSDRAAARQEFQRVSQEVYDFGRRCGMSSAEFEEKYGTGEHHFGTSMSSVWDAMPNKDIDLTKARKRPRIPYPVLKRSLEKRREEAARQRALAAPRDEDPVRSAEALRRKASSSYASSRRRERESFAEWVRKRAGDRSGMKGIGRGERGYKATGLGKYDSRTGVLHIRDFEMGGLRKAQRIIQARKKGRSLSAAMAEVMPSGGSKKQKGGKKHKVGWRRKGKANRRK